MTTQSAAADLSLPIGEPGSGFVRYAAAMSLYQSGMIRADTLEIFRICAPDDQLDPISELIRLAITHDLPRLSRTLT